MKKTQQKAEKTLEKSVGHRTTGHERYTRNRMVIGIIMVIVAVALVLISIPLLNKEEETYSVLVAAQDISYGTKITSENVTSLFKIKQTTDANLVAQCYTPNDTAQFVDQFLVRELRSGEYVYKYASDNGSKLFSTILLEDIDEESLTETETLVTISIPDIIHTVAYIPKAGDIITFYGTRSEEEVTVEKNGELTTVTANNVYVLELLRYVQIYKLLDGNGVDITVSGNSPSMMLMKMPAIQLEYLLNMKNRTSFYISLVSSGDYDKAQAYLKIQDEIIEEYQLLQEAGTIEKSEYTVKKRYVTEVETELDKIEKGAYVQIGFARNFDGSEITPSAITSSSANVDLYIPELLSVVRVTNEYNGLGKSLEIATDLPVGSTAITEGMSDEEREQALDYMGSIGLDLAPEQAECLQEYLSKYQMFVIVIEPERNAKTGEITAYPEFDEVDSEILSVRVANIIADFEAAKAEAKDEFEKSLEDSAS